MSPGSEISDLDKFRQKPKPLACLDKGLHHVIYNMFCPLIPRRSCTILRPAFWLPQYIRGYSRRRCVGLSPTCFPVPRRFQGPPGRFLHWLIE